MIVTEVVLYARGATARAQMHESRRGNRWFGLLRLPGRDVFLMAPTPQELRGQLQVYFHGFIANGLSGGKPWPR